MKGHASREGTSCDTTLPGETAERGEPRHYKPHFVRRRGLRLHPSDDDMGRRGSCIARYPPSEADPFLR